MRPYALLMPVLAALLLGGAAPAVLSPNGIVAAAPPDAWQAVAPEDLLVMTLGSGQKVVIQLAPGFAPVHVANIRALARAGWWDGAGIVRVQDNYVVQWARMPEGQTLPPGVVAHPPAEYDRPADGLAVRSLGFPDSYAPKAGYADGGWPVASDGTRSWLAHCYGMVGVGRDMPPDTGTGEELYAVNGQAPRQLDRNIALVGRVVDGMAILSALPRGTAELGFYADPKQRVPIRTVRVAADMPAGERPRVETMRPEAAAFGEALAARANRRDPFFVRPAERIDLCNAPAPVRMVTGMP
jgi:peptidylprolyl isomerase